jgi:putative PIN family toxin of toxin-antitoxin system
VRNYGLRTLSRNRPRQTPSAGRLNRGRNIPIHEAVVDTNVLVAALRSKRGASYRLVRLIGQSGWRLNISVALALEYEDVLKRRGLLPGVGEANVDEFLDYLFTVSNLVPSVPRLRPSLRDPGDELILEVAVQCGAIIVTHNRKDFAGAERFGVLVRTPAEFLEILGESL